MPNEPKIKRAAAFVDGQNLFYAAKNAFGHSYPNYDPLKLAQHLVGTKPGWILTETFFYTGIPNVDDDAALHAFWAAKLSVLGTRGVRTYSRGLRYRARTIVCPHGEAFRFDFKHEKGVDVRIALGSVRLARRGDVDVVLIFSHDQDLAEVAEEIGAISREERRWIKIASAYPVGPGTHNKRGIDRTDWIRIDEAAYAECLDPLDYRGGQVRRR